MREEYEEASDEGTGEADYESYGNGEADYEDFEEDARSDARWRAGERRRIMLERRREAELRRLEQRPPSPLWRPSQPWSEMPPGAVRVPGPSPRWLPRAPLDLDPGVIWPPVSDLTGEDGWTEDFEAEDFADALRSAMREEYADASDEEMGDALMNVLGSMSPAEAINFGSALNRIGKSASQLVSDPTFVSVAGTALPILGGAAGTLIGGPAGTAVGTTLGRVAASALPARPAPPAAPARPVAATPAPSAAAMVAPVISPRSPGPASAAVAGGSAAAAQGLVLTQQPDVLRSLLATALGQPGRKQVSGVPAAQLLALLSHVFGQAAADADELMYLEQEADDAESVPDDAPAASLRSLYADLLGADNFELAEAAELEEMDP